MRPDDRYAPLALALGMPLGILAWSTVLGLGVARQGEAFAVATSATLLIFGPAIAVGAVRRSGRLTRVGAVLAVWAIGVLVAMPVYFPGERRDAMITGLSMLTGAPEGDGIAATLASALPDEPDVAIAQVPLADDVTVAPLPPAAPLASNEIALPYEGEGRRLSVPVVFEHGGVERETFMMLDTGATYTTLPLHVLRELGIAPGPDAPELVLNTANGQRTAKVVLVDRVWLGDLLLEGVAITSCEDCASDENAGLLGLNVSGGYNITIDADRREVVFSARAKFNRRLDVRPFSEMDARFTRYAGGRVEVELDLANLSPRPILSAVAHVTCGPESWRLEIGAVGGKEATQIRRRLPRHDKCDGYQLVLDEAMW